MNPSKIDLKTRLSNSSPVDAFNIMLGGTNKKDIRELEISSLIPYPDQPFKPYTSERLAELAEDIKANGVISPVIVRPMEDGYQIIAGHNRVQASILAGLFTVPCIVRQLDDNEASLLMVNSNLNQRQELLPSEKAFAYRIQLETMKRQGKRTDLTSDQFGKKLNGKISIDRNSGTSDPIPTSNRFGEKLTSANILAQQSSTSPTQVHRFIRLTYLLPLFLEKVDEGELPVAAGVELSYLDQETQLRLLEYISAYPLKLDMAKASLLRSRSSNGFLSRADIAALLAPEAKPAKEKTALKFRSTDLQSFFPDKKPKDIEREIINILKQHFQGAD